MWDDAVLCQVKPEVSGECLFPGFWRVGPGGWVSWVFGWTGGAGIVFWRCLEACLFICLFICLVAGQLGRESVIYLCSITLRFNG